MWYDVLLNRGWIPDGLVRKGIRSRLAQKLRQEKEGTDKEKTERFRRLFYQLKSSPIAINTQEANEQHYELPPDFFQHILGSYLKYSCGLWEEGVSTLEASETAMMDLYVDRAQIKDGHRILDLGCGWGSLSLYLAEKFPGSQITGVSNSANQKKHIEEQMAQRSLKNIEIVTSDMNTFEAEGLYDRIVSIEMFEHMRNYEKLFKKIARWMKPDGALFVHIFCHREFAYAYEARRPSDWMARYFFSGGTMPSENLFSHFDQDLKVIDQWRVNGTHYQKTCEAWLREMNSKYDRIMPLLEATYGKNEARKWWHYWRLFFMACAELFGFREGQEWFVAHYLLRKKEDGPAFKTSP